MMSRKEDDITNHFRRRSSSTNQPAFARYRKMLPRLEALEREAQEVRHRVQTRRKLIS
jgi:hypothetical protein